MSLYGYEQRSPFAEWWNWYGDIVKIVIGLIVFVIAFIAILNYYDHQKERYYDSLPRHHFNFTVDKKVVVEDHYYVMAGKVLTEQTRYYYWIIGTKGDQFQTNEKGFSWFLEKQDAEIDYIEPEDEAKWIVVTYRDENKIGR